MRNLILAGGLAVAMALPMVVMPSHADASCSGRKTTGTILGGVGGALLGNAVSHGGGGAVVGGVGGAVVGNQIGRSGCGRARTSYSRNTRYRHEAHPVRTVYYDRNGQAYTR